MANFPWPDVIGYPASGNTANLHSIICGAPKGANDQLVHVSYYGDSLPQGTGDGVYGRLNDRFSLNTIVVTISG